MSSEETERKRSRWWEATRSQRIVSIVAIVAIILVLIYYVLLVPRIREMLDLKASPVLIAFALASLIPVPPAVVLGILIMFIWEGHRKPLVGEATA